MKKMKLALISAALLIVSGIVLFGVTMTINDWDFTALNTVEFIEKTYELNGEIRDILVLTDNTHIAIAPGESENVQIYVCEQENMRHMVTVKDGVLSIEQENLRKWQDFIAFTVTTPRISICVPKGDLGKIRVEATTGDVTLENLSADEISVSITTGEIICRNTVCTGEINFESTTGKTTVADTGCGEFVSGVNTGDIELVNVKADGSMSIRRSTGDVKLVSSDAESIDITTTTGDVTGTLLTDKRFDVHAGTGKIRVPESGEGGQCVIRTSTGDIEIRITE